MIDRLPPGLSSTEAASYWLVRIDAGMLVAEERAAFETWHAQSQENADAFAKASQAWKVFDDAAGDPHLDTLRQSALAHRAGAGSRRKMWLGLGTGIAASVLAIVATGTDILPLQRSKADHVALGSTAIVNGQYFPDNKDYTTATGEQKRVKLADGSVITLNTDSAIRVAYSDDRRVIKLLRGQVLFEVAKNKARPFVVQAGDRQVTALGTVFQVRLDSDRMKVTLVEGKVVVGDRDDRPLQGRAAIVPTVLTPGQELVAVIGTPQTLSDVNVEQQLRWRDGYVEFEDVPLGNAIREMNRYSRRQLVISDSETANLRVSGVFRTDNPERFAAIAGELLPIRTRNLPDNRIELSSGPLIHVRRPVTNPK
jgi:transmembrane sensor